MNEILTPQQLAERWSMSVGTLQNWRLKGKGPSYIKLGEGRATKVLYRLDDIVEFENQTIINSYREASCKN